MIIFKMLHPRATHDMLGYVPGFFSEADPRPAREQINANYRSGWFPLKGGRMTPKTGLYKYPGDPALMPIAVAKLRDETIYFYQYEMLSIVQPDGSYEIARVN